MDSDTPGEPWSQAHFLLELPGKWELSQLAFVNSAIFGFCIASRKENAAHIHRFVVAPEFRGKGLGIELMNWFTSIVKNNDLKSITLKVATINTRAMDFYLRYGFNFLEQDELNKQMILKL